MKNKTLALMISSALFLSVLTGCSSAGSATSDNTQKSHETSVSNSGSIDATLTADDYDLYLMSYTSDIMTAHTSMLQLVSDSTSDDVDTAWIAELEGYEVDGVKAVRKIESMDAPSSRLVLHDRVLTYCQEAIDGFQEIADSCGSTTDGDLQLGLDLVYSAIQGLDRCVQGEENVLEDAQLLMRNKSNEPSEDADSANIVSSGMYKVGTDIPAGEYKVTPTGASSAYYLVANDSTGEVSSWVTNANFDDVRYVTVKDGQYITLERCTATLVK